jgi:hypothetical protein
MGNFEKELKNTIALFEIMQKNLDYNTEIKVFEAKNSDLLNRNENQNKLNLVKVALTHNFNFNYSNGHYSVPNSIFVVLVKENMNGLVSKHFEDRSPKKQPSYEKLKQTYKMLLDAQNSGVL